MNRKKREVASFAFIFLSLSVLFGLVMQLTLYDSISQLPQEQQSQFEQRLIPIDQPANLEQSIARILWDFRLFDVLLQACILTVAVAAARHLFGPLKP